MALIITGKTICQLCGNVILANQDVVAFPAFLKRTHPLARYSDAAFHKQCFDKSPDREKIEQLFKKYRTIWENCPKNLKNSKDIDEWVKSAFAEFE